MSEIKIWVSVSRHNSDQDRIDDSLVEELKDRIRLIALEHRYESIMPMVD